MKIESACEITGFCKGHIYNMVSAGRIPYHKAGHSLRFDPDELNDWIKKG
ncbi:helix-turn-helix domain-containing protein [Alistipes indistinctus]